MKKLSRVIFAIGAIAVAGLVIYGVAMLASRALGPGEKTITAECKQEGTEYLVAIQNGQPAINDIQAKACDRLTITNEDDQLRLMDFGVHQSHKAYNGVTEQTLEQGESMSVVLNQAGAFTFHDHLNDTFLGRFTVQ